MNQSADDYHIISVYQLIIYTGHRKYEKAFLVRKEEKRQKSKG